jgi:hypothetical protein
VVEDRLEAVPQLRLLSQWNELVGKQRGLDQDNRLAGTSDLDL